MVSAAEKLAANLNFGVIGKAEELKKRIWFTLLLLIVYRIGTYIPLPGINPLVLEELMSQNVGGLLGMFNMFSGGSLSRMTIFTLSVIPYITASIIMNIMSHESKTLRNLKKEGEAGQRKVNQYTRYLTVFLAVFQSYGIATYLESYSNSAGALVFDPGLFFKVSTVVNFVAGTFFLIWLGEQITKRGIGNGISLIIFTGIIAELPSAIAGTLNLGKTGALSTAVILGLAVLALATIAFIVFMERAQRRIIVQYPKRQRGNKMYGGETTHIPLKMNYAGVIPPIFASAFLTLPIALVGFTGTDSAFLESTVLHLSRGKPLYITVYISLIVFFCFFYTFMQFKPEETADRLKKEGGFIPGRRPGKNTAEYLEYVLLRVTTVGAIYLSAVCVLPEILISQYAVPFYLGGTSLLIVVNVIMDTLAQIQGHLFAHQYEGLIKKVKIKGRR